MATLGLRALEVTTVPRNEPHGASHRNYTVVNTEKGLLEVRRMCCAGLRLSCQLKVQNSLWTATEVTAPWDLQLPE